MNNILDAEDFAREKHKGQKDDSGQSYFYTHIMQVVRIIHQITKDVDVICAAYLHDTIEDTNTSYQELKETFGQRVADLVLEVTHEGKKDEVGYYFPRLKSKEGIMIKLADRLQNISRMGSWNKKRQEHYLKHTQFWKSHPDKINYVEEG